MAREGDGVDVVAARAKAVGAYTVLDCSQSVPHMGVDVQTLGVDAIAFTSHKMLGPTGIGVLWAPLARLEEWPPFLGGGEMIDEVTMAGSTSTTSTASSRRGRRS